MLLINGVMRPQSGRNNFLKSKEGREKMENTLKRIIEANQVLKCFESGSRFYWLAVLVKLGQLSESEAGHVLRG
jgi:hypothetical protein